MSTHDPHKVNRRSVLKWSVAVTAGPVVAGASSLAALTAPKAPATPVDPSFTTAAGYCADAEERAFLRLINDYRAQYGRSPLRHTRTLAAAANHHSIDSAQRNYSSHTLSSGVTWSQNIVNHGYTYSTYKGENIFWGRATASEAFAWWKSSVGHRANMLNANFKAIGIGRAYHSDGSTYTWYWTTTFGGYQDAAVTCSG